MGEGALMEDILNNDSPFSPDHPFGKDLGGENGAQQIEVKHLAKPFDVQTGLLHTLPVQHVAIAPQSTPLPPVTTATFPRRFSMIGSISLPHFRIFSRSKVSQIPHKYIIPSALSYKPYPGRHCSSQICRPWSGRT